MANKIYEVNRVKTLPTTGLVDGDHYLLQKSNGRFELYVVAPNLTLIPVQGVSDDELNRLNQLQQTDIDKLKTGVYTKTEVDNRVTQVNSNLIPVTGTVLPQGPSVPSWVTTNGKAELYGKTGGTTFTQTGGPSTTVSEGSMKVAYYDKSINLWTFDATETPLPSNTNGEISQSDTRGIKGSTTWKAIRRDIFKGDASTDSVVNAAILDIKFFKNVIGNDTDVKLLALGKKFQFSPTEQRDYLGFVSSLDSIYRPTGWTTYFQTSDNKSGIQTYDITNGSTVVGRVTINWDLIPDGYRYISGNTSATNNNSLIEKHFVYPPDLTSVNNRIDNLQTQINEVKPQNRFFSKFLSTANDAYKEKLNKAILDIKFYDLDDNVDVIFYGLGKNYAFSPSDKRDYFAFRRFIDGAEGRNIIPVGWPAFFRTAVPGDLVGLKNYKLKLEGAPDTEVIGEALINWDVFADGERILDSNAWGDNTVLGDWVKVSTSGEEEIPHTEAINAIDTAFLDKYYSSDIQIGNKYVNTGTDGNNRPLGLSTLANFTALWDAFVSSQPYYVTRQLLGNVRDTAGNPTIPMYVYKFAPENRTTTGDPTATNPQKINRVVIIINTHGYEKMSSLVAYEFMNKVVNNPESNDLYSFIRNNIHLDIVINNPWGWDVGGTNPAGSRLNARNVDINRNFPVGWKSTEPYAGASALSELDSQLLKAYIDSVKADTLLCFDFHNFAMNDTPVQSDESKSISWVSSPSPFENTVATALNRATSVPLQIKFPADVPQRKGYLVGTQSVQAPAGMIQHYVKSLNIPSGVLEVSQKFMYKAGAKSYDGDMMNIGTEVFGNYLRIMLRYIILN